MEENIKKQLLKDETGLISYEYIANNINDVETDINFLLDNIIRVDSNGQFVVSTARYLNAIDPQKYAQSIDKLIKAAIDIDREHKYLADLLSAIWGDNYESKADELKLKDDNFRRIYKRLFPLGI